MAHLVTGSSWTSTSSRGRSTCCSSLILREELDLLEVELADVVLAYLDHLEARDELDLEAATEFLVLIAALLELKSRLMLPGEEVEELDELAPAEAAEELLAAHARIRPLPRRRRRTCAALREAEQAVLYRCAPLPPRAAPRAARATPSRPTTRRVLGEALGGLLRTPPPLDLRHIAAPRVSLAERSPCCAGCCAAARFSFDEAVAGRRPDDGRRDAVRAARALQARRGRLGAGRAVRADHRARGERPRSGRGA